MSLSRLPLMQFLAFVALAFALVGNTAIDHPHTPHPGRNPGGVAAPARSSLHTSLPPSLLPDLGHEGHSTQFPMDRGLCGVCRSMESPWLVGSVQNEAAYASGLRAILDESSTTHWSVDPGRGNPPRAPPAGA